MESYRITHWPEPMPAGPGLPIRKALAAMSVGWVTRRFLEREARLNRQEIDTLLDALDGQGALARNHDDTPEIEAAPAGVGAAARVLLNRVSRRIADATRSRHSWWADDIRACDAPPTLPLPWTTLPMPRDTLPAP